MKHSLRHRFSSKLVAIALGLCFVSASLQAEEWPRWRGPRDNGSIEDGSYPVQWDARNTLWKTPLPGKGCSTPIVWNKRIYLTAPLNGKDALLAFDMAGKLLWQTPFGPENPGKHRNGSGSNASPTTDGKGLFVYYKSGTMAAVEFDGKVRWQTNLVKRFGPDTLYWDHGTSPVVTERYLVMARMHEGESWLAAFDKTSGKMAWKVPRNFKTPREGDHGYTTPLVIQQGGKESLLVWGAQHLTAHDVADGATLWSCGDFNPQSVKLWPAVATPVIAGNIAVVPAGRNDRRAPRLHGIRIGGAGDVTQTHRVWKRDDIGTFVPSPAEYKGKVYLVRDRGEVECIDPATGKTIWSEALPKSRANFYSSPLIAGGNLYAAREDGVVFVAKVDGKFELLSENDMGESIIAAPVPVSNGLLLRGENHLFFVPSPADKPNE
jgi:outer membrane protein assembly factor BamB